MALAIAPAGRVLKSTCHSSKISGFPCASTAAITPGHGSLRCRG